LHLPPPPSPAPPEPPTSSHLLSTLLHLLRLTDV
jgi:hypothetical protein